MSGNTTMNLLSGSSRSAIINNMRTPALREPRRFNETDHSHLELYFHTANDDFGNLKHSDAFSGTFYFWRQDEVSSCVISQRQCTVTLKDHGVILSNPSEILLCFRTCTIHSKELTNTKLERAWWYFIGIRIIQTQIKSETAAEE